MNTMSQNVRRIVFFLISSSNFERFSKLAFCIDKAHRYNSLFLGPIYRTSHDVVLKSNTHRRRDEIVESRRVGGVYTNSQLVGDSFVVSSV